jgi:hypothetical protein
MMTVARMMRLGLRRILAPPVFTDRVSDFAQAREFPCQFQDVDGSEILNCIRRWVVQQLEQANANQHGNVMLGKSQKDGSLLYAEQG